MGMEEHSDISWFHQCYDCMVQGICVIKAEGSGQILFANAEMLRMYDCDTQQDFFALTGGRVDGLSVNRDLSLPDDLAGSGKRMFRFSYLTSKKHMRSADGNFQYVKFQDHTYVLLQAFNPQTALQDQNIDELTGFPGASRFYQKALAFAHENVIAGRFCSFCPVSFNIANFRGYNRANGIEGGNRCLRYAAEQLKRVFPDALLTRTEADTFLGLLPRENLEEKIDEVCASVNQYMGRRSYAMKAGIVKFDEDVPAEVIRHSFDMARIACSSVKNDGEHSYAIFQKEMEERMEQRRYILDHFDQALENGYIKVYYQPVVRTLSGKVCSFEALSRWEDPQRGMLSPGIFVPVLEGSRRIGRLDQYMIEHTVQTLHDLLISGRHVLPVSLNLSQLDFDLIQPLRCLHETCARYQVPHQYIHVEITERVLAQNQDRMEQIIRQFHEDGFEVWLDDFGSAYSSLKSLNQFPFDTIKLDMDFFRRFDDRAREIITSIVIMAKRLGMHTLAEGVETAEHLNFLKEIGCERIQGYYYSRPVMRFMVDRVLTEKKLQMESSLEASVYGRSGLVDIVDNDPVSLFLCENGTVRLLTCNSAYQQELAGIGIKASDLMKEPMPLRTQASRRRLENYLQDVFERRDAPYLFMINGKYLRMQAIFVAGVRDFWIGRADLLDLRAADMLTNRHEHFLMQSAPLFDGVYFLNQKKNQIEVIQCVHPSIPSHQTYADISGSCRDYCSAYVRLDDQQRFSAFFDTSCLVKAVSEAKDGYVQEMFRIRREDGNYRWALFSVLPAQDEDNSLLVFERRPFLTEEKQRIVQMDALQQEDEAQKDARSASLLKAFFHHADIPLFYKDRKGRYLAANQEMLAYLGGLQTEEVLGRTAAETGIFVDPEEVSRAVGRVLEHGETVHFSPMTITEGISHRIPVTEFPWYIGNEIAGAAGWVHPDEAKKEEDFITDHETGLMNDFGAVLAAGKFEQSLHRNGDDYCVFLLSLQGYDRMIRIFGDDYASRVQLRIAGMIRDCSCPDGTMKVRLPGCRFLLMGKESSLKQLQKAAGEICIRVRSLREMDGVEWHFEMDEVMGEGSEADGFVELISLLQTRLSRKHCNPAVRMQDDAANYNIQLPPAVLDDLPEQSVLIDPENNEVLFVNKAMKRALNLPDDFNPHGHRCFELLQGRSVPCANCIANTLPRDALAVRKQTFHASGRKFATRESLVYWKGRQLRMCICFPYDDPVDQVHNLLNNETWANEAITSGMAEKNPSDGIQKSVDHIGWNLQAERLMIFEERRDQTVSCTYEWCAPEYPVSKNELRSVLMQKLEPLYRMFQTNRVVVIPDYPAFQKQHPDFWLPGENIRNVISGHLMNSGRSIGFTLVLNANEQNLHQDGYILSTLTEFLAVMIQNRNSIQEALELSMHDPMTGVLNRAGLSRYLRTGMWSESSAFISGDINGLKAMNDSHGHLAGDRLICTISDILVSFADKEHVIRMGGDEFLMIKEGMNDAGAADLIRQIRETCRVRGVSMALGYTIHTGELNDIDEILKKADKEMYADKGSYYHRRSTDRLPLRKTDKEA